jgi:cell division protein FtsN
MTGRGRRQPSRLASLLFVVGCLAVLGTTFMLGVMAGRFWPREPSAPTSTLAKGSKEAAAARLGGDRSARPTEPAPTLTFYQDLTAPLTSPPPPAKPTRSARADKSDKPDATRRPEATPPAELPKAGSGFTVQVGAFKAKEPADAMRAKLAAAGLEAYVAQLEAPSGVRFRVRVGSFATRSAAQEIADRVGRERALPAYVTTQ